MENKKTKKGLIIGIVVALIALVGVVITILMLSGKEDAYRLIKVYELDGKAVVSRPDTGDIDAYSNMVLESGDSIYLQSGTMTLKLDDDKYVYVEEGSRFELIATGTSSNSKTTINLTEGAITNDIQNKLSDESSYEVNTPNSNMAVRGTTFRVCIYKEEGVLYTKNTVFEGEVATRLKYKDGSYSVEVVSVPGGKEIIIYEDASTTDYLTDIVDIDYDALPEEIKKLLEDILGEEFVNAAGISTRTDAEKEEKGPFTVTFMYNGNVFGTQTVEKGKCAQVPTLMPAEKGSWDFDFTTPIMEDTDINWR